MLTKKLNNHIERRVARERDRHPIRNKGPVMENKIKYNTYDVGGEVVKDNETYTLKDNKTLKNLVLSSTLLYREQSTRGHRHVGQEEVYIFVQGRGAMIVGDEDSEPFDVSAGDIVLIPDGAFHRVINNGDVNLLFNCVFDGKRNH
jgi:mannose-6-phosphate isomerase-like protein (cupin superfamily)